MRIMLNASPQGATSQRHLTRTGATSGRILAAAPHQADTLTLSRPPQFAGSGSSKMTPEKILSQLNKEKSIDATDLFGNTTLIKAARKGRLDLVVLLLANGANVNHKNFFGDTPLIEAVSKGHYSVTEMLLDMGKADPRILNHAGKNALTKAIHQEKSDLVKLFLDKDPTLAHFQDHEGNTVLTLAAQAGRDLRDFAESLRAKGGDLSWYPEDGWAANHVEQSGGSPRCVKALLEGGADANHRNHQGFTPLMYAGWNGHDEVAKTLLETGKANPCFQDGDGNTALTAAVVGRKNKLVKRFLDVEPKLVHIQDKEGDTALSVAASWGDRKAVELLLESKANINHQNKKGETPLSLAAYRGHFKTVELLLDKGADPFIPNNIGHTPQRRAENVGRTKIARILKKAEAARINNRRDN